MRIDRTLHKGYNELECLRLIHSGRSLKIYAIANGDRCILEKDLKALRRKNSEIHAKVLALIYRIAEDGTDDLGKQIFKIVRTGCFEIKDNQGLFRIFGFIDPERHRVIILKNTWNKSGKKEQNEQIDLLAKRREQYIDDPLPLEPE